MGFIKTLGMLFLIGLGMIWYSDQELELKRLELPATVQVRVDSLGSKVIEINPELNQVKMNSGVSLRFDLEGNLIEIYNEGSYIPNSILKQYDISTNPKIKRWCRTSCAS